LSLQIELDKERLERGLDQAARRLSQKYPIHGFRPGKAPRFMIERTFGRNALLEEATEDLVNKAFRDALKQEGIEPVGQASLRNVDPGDPFTFTIHVPVQPTVNVGDYRAIRAPLELAAIEDEQVERALDVIRDRHVVLKPLDENPRPAQEGDQLRVKLQTIVDGELIEGDDIDDEDEVELEADDALDTEAEAEPVADDSEATSAAESDHDDEDAAGEGDEAEDEGDEDEGDEDEGDENDEDDELARAQTLDLVKGRLVDELYEGLLGVNVGERRTINAQMPDDHANDEVRGKTVTFKVKVLSIQERLLPDWDELPTLEEFEGTLDELRAKTREDLLKAAREGAERKAIDTYLEQLVNQTEYDIPDVMIDELAHSMLHDQEREFARYGITLEQMLQFRRQTHEEAVQALWPDAERQTKVTLALREVVQAEGLNISAQELQSELTTILADYKEEERASVAQLLQGQLLNSVANSVLDRKLRERLLLIAIGEAPALDAPAAESDQPAPDMAEPEVEPNATDARSPADEAEASTTASDAAEEADVPATARSAE
jgi:trigger factor